jgi:outer membrane lipoprotein-sorting protein
MPTLPLYLSLLLVFVLPPKISSTRQLVEQMQKKYTGKWAHSLTFTQYNTLYKNDTLSGTSVWYEAIKYPDKFRIDFGEPKEGNAVIFANDSVYQFKAGELKGAKKQPNNLLLLAGGIYFLSIEEAFERLKEAGYDLTVFHEDVWQGKPVYVTGAQKGDLRSNQFWIDKQHLYLVRTITGLPNGHIQEAQFSKHIRTAGGWTETEVLFLEDGKQQQLEVYKDIQSNKPLPEGLFTAHNFGKSHWRPY